MVKNTIEILNEIIRLYSNANDNIGKKDYSKHYKALSRYLFVNGLIKKTTNISKAKKFLVEFEKEIKGLKSSDLNTITEVLWQLQTGDIIPISELIYIDKLSLPVHLIEITKSHKNISNAKTPVKAKKSVKDKNPVKAKKSVKDKKTVKSKKSSAKKQSKNSKKISLN